MRQLTADEIRALRACPCMKVRAAEQVYHINRNALYRLMDSGALPFVHVGTVRLLRTEALEKLVLEGLPAAAEGPVNG
jgi:hypothetical protein